MIDERSRYANQARFLEEVSEGLRALMEKEGRTKAWLADALGCSRPAVSKILEGSHNFTLEKLADVCLALDRGVHVTFGANPVEMRLVQDEANMSFRYVPTPKNGSSSSPFQIDVYRAAEKLARTKSQSQSSSQLGLPIVA